MTREIRVVKELSNAYPDKMMYYVQVDGTHQSCHLTESEAIERAKAISDFLTKKPKPEPEIVYSETIEL